MKKSGSCPNLQGASSSTALSPFRYTMKKCTSSQTFIQNVAIDQAFPQVSPPPYEITKTPDGGQEYYMTMTAPAHVVGICMLENPEGINGVPESERDKNLASCIASPCEAEACSQSISLDGVRRNMYMLANENRAGEIIARIRKLKRDQK